MRSIFTSSGLEVNIILMGQMLVFGETCLIRVF